MDNFEDLFTRMKIEMANQTKEIISQLDEKLIPFTHDIEKLKLENKILKEKISNLEKYKRKNNLIIYGIKENEKTVTDLMDLIKQKLGNDLNIGLEHRDIDAIYRLGKKDINNPKTRPILISFVNGWIKNEIMMNKKKLKDAYVSDDYPKEVLDTRKELQKKLSDERNKGNYAVIKYDKLIIKEKSFSVEKRKREISTSPKPQQRKQYVASKTNKINAYDVMRGRSNSFTSYNSAFKENS